MIRNLILIGIIAIQTVLAQSIQPVNGGDGRFQTIIFNDDRGDLSQRSFGSYYMDYLEYDRNYLNSTINNGVYGNLCFTNTDTSYGVIPFVAEYYDNIVLSTNLTTWHEVSWADIISFEVDSVFIKLNVDNTTGNPCKLKMKILEPLLITSGGGNWYDFSVAPIWQDSIITSSDVGTHTSSSITFATVGFDAGITVSGKFAVMFEFSGSVDDTCRLTWSYPTNGNPCSNGAVSPPNATPVQWDFYPTSYYSICTGGTGLDQNVSVGFPRVTGSKGFAYYVDCSNPASPYINDVVGNGFDGNKNQFQHWNIWTKVTVLDQIGIENNSAFSSLKLFPNPVTDQLNLSFSILEKAGETKINILDITGKTVYSGSLGMLEAGSYQKALHLDLKSGTYILRLSSGNDVGYSKFTFK